MDPQPQVAVREWMHISLTVDGGLSIGEWLPSREKVAASLEGPFRHRVLGIFCRDRYPDGYCDIVREPSETDATSRECNVPGMTGPIVDDEPEDLTDPTRFFVKRPLTQEEIDYATRVLQTLIKGAQEAGVKVLDT